MGPMALTVGVVHGVIFAMISYDYLQYIYNMSTIVCDTSYDKNILNMFKPLRYSTTVCD